MDAGFVEIVYGGAEQGRYLCQHPTVASIHLTGSAATYNAIVWGDNKEKVRRGRPCSGGGVAWRSGGRRGVFERRCSVSQGRVPTPGAETGSPCFCCAALPCTR